MPSLQGQRACEPFAEQRAIPLTLWKKITWSEAPTATEHDMHVNGVDEGSMAGRDCSEVAILKASCFVKSGYKVEITASKENPDV